MMEDKDELIERLRSEVAEVRLERDGLKVAIAEHVEALGGEGCDGDALRDSLGQLERLLEGEDLDTPMEGVAGQVSRLESSRRAYQLFVDKCSEWGDPWGSGPLPRAVVEAKAALASTLLIIGASE